MNFQASPISHNFFPSGMSPTERMLRVMTPPEALFAALEGGWLDPSAAAIPNKEGVPALAQWALLPNNQFRGLGASFWDRSDAWPTPGETAWPSATHNVENRSAAYATDLKAEWMAGWFLLNAPDGVGRARWAPSPNTPSHGSLTAFSLLGVLVGNQWERAVEQSLRRTDSPRGAELDVLEVPNPVYTHWFRKGVMRDNKCVPLLHHAFIKNDLGLIRTLLVAGADANAPSADGTPAFFRAQSPEALRLAMEFGARPDRTPSHGIGMSAWLAVSLGSTTAASPLMAISNEWLSAHLSVEAVAEAKMPDLAGILVSGTLSGLKEQMAQLKVPRRIQWKEDGQTWTWSRRALALCLEGGPATVPRGAAVLWGLHASDLGDPLIPSVNNNDLLWLLGTQLVEARTLWKKGVASGKWTSPDGARVQTMIEGLGLPLSRIWLPPPAYNDYTRAPTRQAWLLPLGLAAMATDTVENGDIFAFEAWKALPQSAEGELQKAIQRPAMEVTKALLDRFWNQLRTEPSAAARCLGEAWVLAGMADWVDLAGNLNLQASPSFESSLPGPLPESTKLPISLAHACWHASRSGVGLEDGAGGERLERSLSHFERVSALQMLVPLVRQCRMEAAVSGAAAPKPRPRM